jgi:hypothetical protein
MGACRVEVLDREGAVVPGYELASCDEMHGNGTAMAVTWKGKADLGALAGTPVRLRFVLRACKVYAFGFVAA